MTSSTSPSRGGEPTFDESITIRSPLRAGIGAPDATDFVAAAGFFPAVCFPAGFVFAAGFEVAGDLFAAGFAAFFFDGTVDLLSSRGCRDEANLTARARMPQTAGPATSVTVAVCSPCWSIQVTWICSPGTFEWIAAPSSSSVLTAWPSIVRITAGAVIPTFAAGLPGWTPATRMPGGSVSPSCAAVAGPDLVHDPDRGVDRDRDPRAVAAGLARARGDDADDLPLHVQEGAAGVSGMHIGGDLDHVVQPFGAGAGRVARGDRTMYGRHRTGRGGRLTAPAERVPDRGDRIPDPNRRGITDRDRWQAGRAVQPEQGHIVGRIDPDDRWRRGAVTRDRDLDARGALDDVVVRQDLAVGREDHAGPGAQRTQPIGSQRLLGRIDVDDRADRARGCGAGGRGRGDDGARGRDRGRSGGLGATGEREECPDEGERHQHRDEERDPAARPVRPATLRLGRRRRGHPCVIAGPGFGPRGLPVVVHAIKLPTESGKCLGDAA